MDLYRRLMPRSKLGRSRPTTAAAAPATSGLVYPQVFGREQMAIAATARYSHGLEDTFRREGDMSFGCSKARPRYHFQINNLEEESQAGSQSGVSATKQSA